jgi:hypothetical protein
MRRHDRINSREFSDIDGKTQRPYELTHHAARDSRAIGVLTSGVADDSAHGWLQDFAGPTNQRSGSLSAPGALAKQKGDEALVVHATAQRPSSAVKDSQQTGGGGPRAETLPRHQATRTAEEAAGDSRPAASLTVSAPPASSGLANVKNRQIGHALFPERSHVVAEIWGAGDGAD